MAKKLTVLIPTTGRSDLLEDTVSSFASCRKPTIYHETILVENGPKAGTEKISF